MEYSLLSYDKLDPESKKAVEELFNKPNRFINEGLYELIAPKLVAIIINNEVVGCFHPHESKISPYEYYWRTLPLIIDPSRRERGIAKAVLSDFYTTRPGFAIVHEKNLPSHKLHLSLGFEVDEEFSKKLDGNICYIKK